MTHPQSEKQKQRRRGILKAVAGVPVIFTLPTGAALAEGSFTCIDKSKTLATQQSTIPKGASTASDTWVRYKVARMTIKLTGGQGSGTVDDAFEFDNNWYRVTSTGVVSDVTLTVTDPTSDSQSRYYYLLVDHAKYSSSAFPKSFIYLGNAVADPIAGTSCWNSVTPGANLTTTILN